MSLPRAIPALAACTALACLTSPAEAAPRETPFTAAPVLELGPGAYPKAVAIGDFDGDGRQDLAVADQIAKCVYVQLGNGDGTFRDAGAVTGLDALNDVVVGDFNGDGSEDLAVAARINAKNAVGVALGHGTGGFEPAQPLFLPGSLTRSLATGDFNGDGRTDLVAATDRQVSVRTAAANGGFAGGSDVAFAPPGTPQPELQSVGAGDFDGNGTEDVVVAAIGESLEKKTLSVLPGLGNGGFADRKPVSMPGPALGLAVGDVNADARQDVVAPIFTTNSVSVKLGDGSGTLPSGEEPPEVAVGRRPVTIALGDFDGDGLEDLVTAEPEDNTLTVRLGDGAGGFEPGAELPVDGPPLALAVGDFDADGRADIASADGAGGTVTVKLGAGKAPLAGNLLSNGGFEAAPGARRSSETVPIPGWRTTGGATALRYGVSPVDSFPSRLDAPRYQTGGSNFLWGGRSGPGGITRTSQVVDVGGSAAAIDRGRATVRLSAWLGGALRYRDSMTATAEFRDAGGASKGVLRVDPDKDRRGLTTLLRSAGAAEVPPGTRRIEVVLTSLDDDEISSAMADNVKLELETPPGGDPDPGPRPAEQPGGGGADRPGGGPGGPGADRDAPVIGRVRIRAGRRGAKVRYTLSEPAAVSVRIERIAKKRRRVAVGTLRRAGKRGGNRVALRRRIGRKALRPGAYRLVLTAVDAAGNRSVATSRRFRIAR